MQTQYKEISIDRLVEPDQPLRDDITPESLQDLVSSISQVGIIEPIVVSPLGDNFQIIAGHRRYRSARIVGLDFLPCIIRDDKELDAEMLKLHENLARSEISPIQWAKHINLLKQHYELSNANIANSLGMSEAWVSQHLEILNYPEEIYQALENSQLSFSAARELAQIKDSVKRAIYVNSAVKGGVTPSLAAQWRREANSQPLPPSEDITATQETAIPETVPLAEKICPVCNENISPDQEVILTVHAGCQPKE